MIHLLLIGLAIAVTYFAATWAVSVRVKNYGLLDVAWSYGVAILAPIYAVFSPGEPVRKWLLTGIGVAWSLRLGTYILLRVLRHHPKSRMNCPGSARKRASRKVMESGTCGWPKSVSPAR